MAKKYKFTTHEDIRGRFVRCPKCNELLSPVDLDTFPQCPYCSVQFERSNDLDDFVVEPMIQSWLSIFTNTRPDGRKMH